MTAYRFRVLNADGTTENGRIEAESLDQAEEAASRKGKVISIVPLLEARANSESPKAKAISKISVGKKKTKTDEVITVIRNMAVMAESGVPLKEALDTVSAEAGTPDLTNALRKLRDEVVAGHALADAMRTLPKFFPEIVCDMVSVGEDGGKMDAALSSAADHMERSAAMKAKIVNALIYPCILLGVSLLSVASLVVFVLPQFMETFKQMGIEPPMLTKMLMFAGDSLRKWPHITFAVMVGLHFGGKYALKQPIVASKVQAIILRLPVVGDLMTKIAISRCIHTLASLTGANIRLVEALHHTAKVAGVPAITAAFEQAKTDLEQGDTLGESLTRTKTLPSTLVQLISIGERTSRLPQLLKRAAVQMESEADARLKAVVSLFEPMLIVVMGGIIGMITLSIITPLFTVIQKIN
ncbi:MAG: type II secretion system F family protein [Fimbriimonadaceae bacterium]|nr:type II secretion system F family protein [Fimbriimonadaceae bacterium]